eukprot:TRINITY_DN13582_c0_g1_i1.p1 TRINITY_DN13582_c0_g1~~TRINITY_DN13582_c0_g1_i1.p1  ORF type:complete len:145 (+),score=36.79 TRINITY_DN13582_c0_g1_i1:127-561(+)
MTEVPAQSPLAQADGDSSSVESAEPIVEVMSAAEWDLALGNSPKLEDKDQKEAYERTYRYERGSIVDLKVDRERRRAEQKAQEEARARDGPQTADDWDAEFNLVSAQRNERRSSILPKLQLDKLQIGRAVQQECRDRSRMPSSA